MGWTQVEQRIADDDQEKWNRCVIALLPLLGKAVQVGPR
jgi:hypothetical protein